MAFQVGFGLLCVILIFGLTESQQPQSTNSTTSQIEPDVLLSSLSTLVPNFQEARLDKEEIAKRCPQLWDPKQKDYNVTAGFLGSLQEIDNFCADGHAMCNFAKWMSNYLCNASQGLREGEAFPSPPPIKDFANLKNVSMLCSELGSSELKTSITAAVRANGSPRTEQIVTFFNQLHDILNSSCPTSCSGENLRACQVVLQGLRTIASWEELKQKLTSSANEKASVLSVETPTTAVKSTVVQTTSSAETSTKPSLNATEILKSSNNSNQLAPLREVTVLETFTTTTTVSSLDTLEVLEEDIPVPESTLDEKMEEAKPEENKEDKEEVYEDQDDAEQGMEDIVLDDKKPSTDQATNSMQTVKEQKNPDPNEPKDTHFIIYFLVCLVLIVFGYVLYHRRTRVVALIIEGRGPQRRRNSTRGRTSSATYKRLDNNLEEVVTSSRAVKSSNVIY